MKLRKRKPGELKRITVSRGIQTVVFIERKTGKQETYIKRNKKGVEYERV